MSGKYLRLSACLVVFAGCAAAQLPNSLTLSNLSVTMTSVNNTYTNSLTLTGTASFSGLGTATVKGTGTATRERGLACGNYIQLNLTFSFVAPDSFNVLVTWPLPIPTMPLPFNIVGGTGTYKGLGGSGTMAVTTAVAVSDPSGASTSITGSGSGMTVANGPLVAAVFPSGIVPVFSSVPMVQPGSWISIYGSNMANTTATWASSNFQTTIGNVTVTIDGKPGYLWYVSPTLINVQVPDDSNQSCVNVVVTTPNGTVNSQVTLQPQQPSFSLLGDAGRHIVGEILTPSGTGTYASGAYDLVGPVGAFSFATRPVRTNETIVLFGVGFGATQTPVAAGTFPAASTTTSIVPVVTIGGVQAKVLYSGLIGPGLYQLNVVVPAVPSGDQVIQATIGAQNPRLFSADATQNCTDPAGGTQANCAVYLTVF